MPKVSHIDSKLIEELHALVFNDGEARNQIDSAFKEALALFDQADYALPYASYNIPITNFADKMSAEQKDRVALCRVFILRAGCKMPNPEIHRNSIQRLVSFKGEGSIFSATPGGVDMTFNECAIVSPNENNSLTTQASWDVVPENTWHFPKAGPNEDWFTVTFHSASEADIIDEHWKP